MIDTDIVIVTGMSGAGRTEAVHAFEDLGFYCIDNLPIALLPHLENLFYGEAAHESGTDAEHPRRIAVVCDARLGIFFASLLEERERLRSNGLSVSLLFLDADDAKLLARYKSSRRRHPLCTDGMTIGQGIEAERSLLAPLKACADNIIDTTSLLPLQLKAKINALYKEESRLSGLAVTVYSFGFKHGAALDADIVIDVRFLPNPYYFESMRHLTGLDSTVRDFVLYREETQEFMIKWKALLDCVMPGYVAEGKQQLAIAIGCTGGQHRSVALAEATGNYLKSKSYCVSIAHRDLALASTKAAQ